MIKIGTLFSGVGAPELAMRSFGVDEIEFACDNDPYVKETYLANHDCKKFYDDIAEVDHINPVDVLVFGFPCQPYSMAGEGRGLTDERGKLVLKALDIINRNKPKSFVAENVEGLILRDNGKTLRFLLGKFHKMGYKVKHTILNSLDFGVSQNRRRLWIVGQLNGEFEFPQPTGKYPPLSSVLDHKTDKSVFATPSFLAKPKVRQRLSSYASDYINCITQTICRNGSSSEYISYVAAVNRAIGQTRKPTVAECCRLFGFPGDFHFPENICTTRQYAMLANSMVVPVVKKILAGLI